SSRLPASDHGPKAWHRHRRYTLATGKARTESKACTGAVQACVGAGVEMIPCDFLHLTVACATFYSAMRGSLRDTDMVRAIIGLLLLILVPSAAVAEAEKRIALLIGNQAYAEAVGPLRNPHKDIVLVGRALEDVGFTLLAPRKDATRDDM